VLHGSSRAPCYRERISVEFGHPLVMSIKVTVPAREKDDEAALDDGLPGARGTAAGGRGIAA